MSLYEKAVHAIEQATNHQRLELCLYAAQVRFQAKELSTLEVERLAALAAMKASAIDNGEIGVMLRD
jgi:hypothetical protein